MSDSQWHQVQLSESFGSDLRSWFEEQATAAMPWLLVHADDGVIWGRRENDGSIRLSSDVITDQRRFPAIAVPLRQSTLLEARLFGKAGEVLLWRSNNGFNARRIDDSLAVHNDVLDEFHLLWGQGQKKRLSSDFTYMVEGQQGPQHAVPIIVQDTQRAALCVRHYVQYDKEGQAYVYLSRLVDLVAR